MTGTGWLRRSIEGSRCSRAMKIRMLVIVAVAVVVVIGYLVFAPRPSSAPAQHLSYTPVTDASTTTRGIVNNEINVIFPVVSLSSLTGQEGLATDIENGQQDQAIDLYVNDINKNGGINGKKINVIIVPFDPSNEAEMRGLCKQWTEGFLRHSLCSTASVRGRRRTSCASLRKVTRR